MVRIGIAKGKRTIRSRLILLVWAGLLAAGLLAGCGPPSSPQAATAPASPALPTTADVLRTEAPPAAATQPPAPLSSDPPSTSAAHCRLFILAGQSNMVGRGRYDDLPAEERALPGNVTFHQVALNSNLQPVHDQLGPEYGLTHSLAPAYPGEILVVKYAVDASSLLDWAPRWDRPRAEITGNPHFGPLYHSLLGFVAQLQAGQVQAGREAACPLAAVVWMQGERDARFPEASREYEGNLEVLIRSLRRDLDAPGLPFLLGRIDPPRAYYPAVEEVQHAQAAVAQRLEGVVLVSTEGLAKHDDELHYNTAGQLELGRRFGEAYLQIEGAP